jgi:hypothetical protein
VSADRWKVGDDLSSRGRAAPVGIYFHCGGLATSQGE